MTTLSRLRRDKTIAIGTSRLSRDDSEASLTPPREATRPLRGRRGDIVRSHFRTRSEKTTPSPLNRDTPPFSHSVRVGGEIFPILILFVFLALKRPPRLVSAEPRRDKPPLLASSEASLSRPLRGRRGEVVRSSYFFSS